MALLSFLKRHLMNDSDWSIDWYDITLFQNHQNLELLILEIVMEIFAKYTLSRQNGK